MTEEKTCHCRSRALFSKCADQKKHEFAKWITFTIFAAIFDCAFSPTQTIACVESVTRMSSPLTNAAVSSVIGVFLLHFSDSPPLRFLSHSLAIMFALSFFYSVLFLPSLFRFLDSKNNILATKGEKATDQSETTKT